MANKACLAEFVYPYTVINGYQSKIHCLYSSRGRFGVVLVPTFAVKEYATGKFTAAVFCIFDRFASNDYIDGSPS